jgi:hypothetical protein
MICVVAFTEVVAQLIGASLVVPVSMDLCKGRARLPGLDGL